MKEVYKDYIPANARVVVNYAAEEKVKFSYPREWTYKKAVWKCAFPTLVTFWLTLHMAVMGFVALVFGLPWVIGYTIWNIMVVKTKIIPESVVTYSFFNELGPMIMAFVIVMVWVLGIPALVTWYLARDKERLSKVIPKVGYWNSRLSGEIKEKVFTSKDVDECKAFIHSFSNVYLNYVCSGEFNDYLERIEIFEIPFDYVNKRIFRKDSKVKNDFEFRAVFHFSKKPKAGDMVVEFS